MADFWVPLAVGVLATLFGGGHESSPEPEDPSPVQPPPIETVPLSPLPHITPLFRKGTEAVINALLPNMEGEPSPFTTPFLSLIDNPLAVIEAIMVAADETRHPLNRTFLSNREAAARRFGLFPKPEKPKPVKAIKPEKPLKMEIPETEAEAADYGRAYLQEWKEWQALDRKWHTDSEIANQKFAAWKKLIKERPHGTFVHHLDDKGNYIVKEGGAYKGDVVPHGERPADTFEPRRPKPPIPPSPAVTPEPEPELPSEPIQLVTVWPRQTKLSPAEAVEIFLKGTPYYPHFTRMVRLKINLDTWFSHTWMLAPQGGGKTTLLKNTFLHHSSDENSLVVIDTHGRDALLDSIARLKNIDRSRMLYISPSDMSRSATVNLFDIGYDDIRRFDEKTAAQAINAAISTLLYCFTILGVDVTDKQATPLTYVARLLTTAFPQVMNKNATINDMRDLLGQHPPSWFREVIAALNDTPRRFFETNFLTGFKESKQQIIDRIDKLLADPALEHLLTAQKSTINLYDELQNKNSIILIDPSGEGLWNDDEKIGVYGRIWLSLIYRAILQRVRIAEAKRRPTFLFIDEVWQYFEGSKLDTMLVTMRKFHCGCVMAHHGLWQASQTLQSALRQATAIKMAGEVADDANAMARAMRTTPEFILSQPKYTFTTYISGVTPQAVPVRIADDFSREPRMSEKEYDEFRERNRERPTKEPSFSDFKQEPTGEKGFDKPDVESAMNEAKELTLEEVIELLDEAVGIEKSDLTELDKARKLLPISKLLLDRDVSGRVSYLAWIAESEAIIAKYTKKPEPKKSDDYDIGA